MTSNSVIKRGIIACAVACSVALVGCGSGASNALTPDQQANRAYMSQVNEVMAELDGDLEPFVDAVSRGDVVTMRTQADNAFRVLDELEGIEAPEALGDVHKSYVEGTKKLREALEEYVELYTKVESSSSSFDQSSYDSKVKEIQKLYDEGVAALESGDKAAAEA